MRARAHPPTHTHTRASSLLIAKVCTFLGNSLDDVQDARNEVTTQRACDYFSLSLSLSLSSFLSRLFVQLINTYRCLSRLSGLANTHSPRGSSRDTARSARCALANFQTGGNHAGNRASRRVRRIGAVCPRGNGQRVNVARLIYLLSAAFIWSASTSAAARR